MKKLVILLIVAAACNVPGVGERVLAQSDTPKVSCRVQVIVTANQQIAGSISSYIKRELRSLHDVVITDNNPQYNFRIVATELKSDRGTKIGVGISCVITESLALDAFVNMLEVRFPECRIDWDILKDRCKDQTEILLHKVVYTPHEDLRKTCEKLVADFDVTVLDPRRKSIRNVLDTEK